MIRPHFKDIETLTVTDRPSRLQRFGVFEADLDEGELRKRGVRVRVPHQAFRVLEMLVEHPGQLVSREDLKRLLWPADTFVEFDRGVNNAISRLRDILDDSSTSPRFIETIPRRGYRFIATVESVARNNLLSGPSLQPSPPRGIPDVPLPDVAPAERAETVGPVRPNRKWRNVFIAVGLAAILVTTLASWVTAGDRNAGIKSLAVLPLVYKSAPDQQAQAYLADGMTDAVITELSRLGSLRVISETSSRRYKDTTKSLRDIGRELGVDGIVEGSVFREGNLVRVTVQLVRTDTDMHVWAQTYTRALDSVLRLQADLALAITGEIGARVTPQEHSRLTATGTLDPEAYRLYVLGHQLRQKQTEPELYGALDHFRRSLKIAPGYARAYWGIAETWISLAGWTGYVPPREGFPKAKAAAQQALAIDASMAEAHSSLALVTELYDWDMAAADRLYREALTLSPNDALTHERYSLHLFRTRRSDEGLTQAQRAFELNPLSSDNNIALASRLFTGGRRDEGLAAMRKATELAPLYYDGWVHLGEMYNHLGRPEEAVAAVRHGIDLSDGGSHAIQMLASVLVKQGKKADAEALLRPLEARPTHRNPYEIAMLRLTMGDTNAALRWLLTACEERTPQMGFFSFAQNDKVFDPIRRDPRFAQVAGCGDHDGSRQ